MEFKRTTDIQVFQNINQIKQDDLICEGHLKVTRLDKIKICTNCSITKSFFGAQKYFQSNDELKAFESYYASLPLYKKIWENSYLVYFILIILLLSGLRFISSVT